MEQNRMGSDIQIDSLQQKIELKLQEIDLKQQMIEMEQKNMRLELQKGTWCGYQDWWNKANEKIEYDEIVHAATNMNIPGMVLKTKPGKLLSQLSISELFYIIISFKTVKIPNRSVHSSCERCVESLL